MSYTRGTSSPIPEVVDEGSHDLLEPPPLAYTNLTVRRAFIVWVHCGQQNKFKNVCNYYHFLESFEDKLPPEKRVASRHHEFELFSNAPPTSLNLHQIFPNLYSQSNFVQHYINKVEAIRNDACVFRLEGFHEIKRQKGVTTAEIVHTSKMIKSYCKSHMKTLRKFLVEFKEYSRKCVLKNTVINVAFYTKRKLIEDELVMMANIPKTYSFLNSNDDEILTNSKDTNLNEISTSKKIMTDADRSLDFIKKYWNDLGPNYIDVTIKLRTRWY